MVITLYFLLYCNYCRKSSLVGTECPSYFIPPLHEFSSQVLKSLKQICENLHVFRLVSQKSLMMLRLCCSFVTSQLIANIYVAQF